MSYTVYQHINKQNGKRYIGITKRSVEERWGAYGENYSTSPHFWSAIQKYGWDMFDHIVVATGLTKIAACQLEKDLIAKYNTQITGYNMTSGGEDGLMSDEAKKKLSESMLGNKNGLGHKCSDEKRAKIKASQPSLGKHLSAEHRAKLSAAAKVRISYPRSEETKKKISDSHSKLAVIDTDTGELFESVQHCARVTGISASVICRVCKHPDKCHSAYGRHFAYATTETKSLTTIPDGSRAKRLEMADPTNVGEDMV